MGGWAWGCVWVEGEGDMVVVIERNEEREREKEREGREGDQREGSELGSRSARRGHW